MDMPTEVYPETWVEYTVSGLFFTASGGGDVSGDPNGTGRENSSSHLHHDNMNDASYTLQRSLRNIVTPAICGFGFLGNIINLVVLTHIRLRKTDGTKDNGSHLGLIMLAMSDLLFCIALFPRAFVPEHEPLFEHYNVYLLYQLYGTGVVTTFILTSTWLTVVMALLRYIGICHPFTSRRLDGPFFAKVLYATVFCLCCVLNIPTYFQYTLTEITYEGRQFYLMDIGYFDERLPLGKSFIIFKAIVGIWIPTLILLFCNCSLIRALRRSYQMRRRCHVQETASSTSNRLTLTLIIIIISFVLLVIPCETMDFFSEFIRTDSQKTEIFLVIRSIANLCQIVNFCFNFILYCIINVHFRKVVMDLIRCCGLLNGRVPERRGRTLGTYSLRTSTTQMHTQQEISLPLHKVNASQEL